MWATDWCPTTGAASLWLSRPDLAADRPLRARQRPRVRARSAAQCADDSPIPAISSAAPGCRWIMRQNAPPCSSAGTAKPPPVPRRVCLQSEERVNSLACQPHRRASMCCIQVRDPPVRRLPRSSGETQIETTAHAPSRPAEGLGGWCGSSVSGNPSRSDTVRRVAMRIRSFNHVRCIAPGPGGEGIDPRSPAVGRDGSLRGSISQLRGLRPDGAQAGAFRAEDQRLERGD